MKKNLSLEYSIDSKQFLLKKKNSNSNSTGVFVLWQGILKKISFSTLNLDSGLDTPQFIKHVG